MPRVLILDGSRLDRQAIADIPHVHSGSMLFMEEGEAKNASPEVRKSIAEALWSVSETISLPDKTSKVNAKSLDDLFRGV